MRFESSKLVRSKDRAANGGGVLEARFSIVRNKDIFPGISTEIINAASVFR
jgi:hypothetical protein